MVDSMTSTPYESLDTDSITDLGDVAVGYDRNRGDNSDVSVDNKACGEHHSGIHDYQNVPVTDTRNTNSPTGSVARNTNSPTGSVARTTNSPTGSVVRTTNSATESVARSTTSSSATESVARTMTSSSATGSVARTTTSPNESVARNTNSPTGSVVRTTNSPTGSVVRTTNSATESVARTTTSNSPTGSVARTTTSSSATESVARTTTSSSATESVARTTTSSSATGSVARTTNSPTESVARTTTSSSATESVARTTTSSSATGSVARTTTSSSATGSVARTTTPSSATGSVARTTTSPNESVARNTNSPTGSVVRTTNSPTGNVARNTNSAAGNEARVNTPNSNPVPESRPSADAATGNGQNQVQSLSRNQRTYTGIAKYPEYTDELQRRGTFRNWPARLKQSPEMMSGAGFFYSLEGDSVRCFLCGIGLRNWDEDDNPWVEHARWSQRCAYVVDRKGQGFIDLVQNAVRQAELQQALREHSQLHHNGHQQVADQADNADSESASRPSDNASVTSHQRGHHDKFPSDAERQNPLLCDAAQSVLNMGYLPRVVKQCTDELLKLEGWHAMSGKKLMKMIMDKEDVGELNPKQSMVPSQRSNIRRTFDPRSVDKSRLEQENSELKERTLCKICCQDTVSIVFLPCGHLVSCARCAPALKICAVCRGPMKATVRISFA